MQQIIIQQVSIHPLDGRLWKCDKHDAMFQLEIYHTDKTPHKNIGAISEYNGHFSYTVGTPVDVKPRVDVSVGCWLTNIIMNEALRNYIREK